MYVFYVTEIMGNNFVREFRDGTAQSPNSVTPVQDSRPTFDPMLGFPNGRVQRNLSVSAEEMEAVQLQPWEKNYCADLHIKVRGNVLFTSSILFSINNHCRLKSVIMRMDPQDGDAITLDTKLIIVFGKITNSG